MRPLLISKRQFWAWFVCDTVACGLWMLGPVWGSIALPIVSFSIFLLMTPEERRQPQSRKTILWIIAILGRVGFADGDDQNFESPGLGISATDNR